MHEGEKKSRGPGVGTSPQCAKKQNQAEIWGKNSVAAARPELGYIRDPPQTPKNR